MEITLRIEAPELTAALFALASATEKRSNSVTVAAAALERHDSPQPLQAPYTADVVSQMTAPSTATQQPLSAPNPGPMASVPVQPAAIVPPTQADPITTPAAAPSAIPTAVQSYSLEQLAVAATQLVDAGRRAELVGLLNSFGVQALTALPKEQYGAFATQLRTMGAKI
ncbi:hypothetical protein LLE49_19325 [Alicyclobacillus tolerans]|uniref:hypothetical protein n=1 Tax=Alicyclobacillus tolerans TaxID=90970 RepID=UPI001F290DD1|nr:hypothetical protein [Alicyclobacillus tolerans]MCF8566875.1 hypothetical protein [Alicyclobacillus tolerans]